MKDNPEGGFIVNIGSMSADTREAGSSAYVATKSAIRGFTEALRKEVNTEGISVSLIEPGATGTDMQPADSQARKEGAEEMLTVEDVADAILICLDQPRRSSIVGLQVRPFRQAI